MNNYNPTSTSTPPPHSGRTITRGLNPRVALCSTGGSTPSPRWGEESNRILIATALIVLTCVSTSFAQSSSLYRSAKARAAGTVDAGVGVPTTQPAGGVAGANANAVAQVGANNALRISAGSSPVPAAPKNLTLIQHSLTAVAPPEATQVKVHDLIGIIVRHRFRSQTDSRMQQKNEWDVQSKLEAWFRIHDKKWQQQNLAGGKPEIDFQHENEMKNQGRSNRQDVVETRVMGKVIDVKPNGNLIVVGASKISYGEDGQILMLSGEINSRDVLPDRTITSDKIYDLDVEIKNSGTVSEAVKRGWLKEVLDGVKPF